MAVVVSVSVPDDLKKKWDRSNLKISPSQIFQIALETQLDGKNNTYNIGAPEHYQLRKS
tara:strand:+ start:388 stop:564 length:177 start_codon:yes stop_codon:yes gene_type:complete